jgi:hypothetical protein
MNTRPSLLLAAATLVAVSMAGLPVAAIAAEPGEVGADHQSDTTSSVEGELLGASGDPATDAGYSPPGDWEFLDDDRPRWTGRVGAVILQRGRLASEPLIIDGNGPPSPPFVAIVNASDLNLPTSAGVDVGLIRHGEYFDVDLRYFGIQGTATTGPTLAPPGQFVVLPGSLPIPFPASTLYSVSYGTQLDSFEANLRRNVSQSLTILAGFRYLYFRDQFAVSVDSSVFPQSTRVAFDGNNNLFGFQIGADGILWDNGNRFRIESAIKAGVYGNAAQNSVLLSNSSPFLLESKTSAQPTAFVGDLNFTGVYQLTDTWSVRAGYQLLWLAGVAVAADQAADTFSGSILAVNTSGNAFFHGALVGAECNW